MDRDAFWALIEAARAEAADPTDADADAVRQRYPRLAAVFG